MRLWTKRPNWNHAFELGPVASARLKFYYISAGLLSRYMFLFLFFLDNEGGHAL